MWFGEPHPFPEREPPTRLSNVGTIKLKKNDQVQHFNYNIHFLNTVSVRWSPLSTHSTKHFWKFCFTLCSMLGETAATSSLMLFQIHLCPWFLFVHLALEISSQEEVLWLGTLVPMNIEVPTKYPLSHDRSVVFEIGLHSKSPMLYRPALNGNWNASSFARRALKDKFPTPTVPLTAVLQNRQVFLPDPVFVTNVGQRVRDVKVQNVNLPSNRHRRPKGE